MSRTIAYFKEGTVIAAPQPYQSRFQVLSKVPVSESQVYICLDILKDQEVILKAEIIGGRRSRIDSEVRLYKKLKSCDYFDIVKEYFIGLRHRILILEKRGIDLRRHYRSQIESGLWRDTHLNRYAVQMIDGLRKCHSRGVIHLDPKPNNYVLDASDPTKVYLIDFDCAKEFVANNGQHIPFRTGLSSNEIRGNRTYISIYGHDREEQSRRDDMIFLGYSLIWMARKGLPWNEKKSTDFSSKNEYNMYIKNEKLRYSLRQLCRSPEDKELSHLVRYMEHCYSLRFAEEPDYQYLISLFL